MHENLAAIPLKSYRSESGHTVFADPFKACTRIKPWISPTIFAKVRFSTGTYATVSLVFVGPLQAFSRLLQQSRGRSDTLTCSTRTIVVSYTFTATAGTLTASTSAWTAWTVTASTSISMVWTSDSHTGPDKDNWDFHLCLFLAHFWDWGIGNVDIKQVDKYTLKVRKFLGSIRYRKSPYFLGVPIRKFLWLILKSPIFTRNTAQLCLKRVLNVVFINVFLLPTNFN